MNIINTLPSFSLYNPYNNFYKMPVISSFFCSQKQQEETGKAKELINRISKDSAYQLREEEKQLLKVSFQQHMIELKTIPADQLKSLCSELLREDFSLADHIEAVLEFFDVSELLKMNHLDKKNAVQSIRSDALLRDPFLASVLMTKVKSYVKEIIPETIAMVHHIIELLISVCGFSEIGPNNNMGMWNSINSSYEAKAKIEFYLSLFAYPATIFASIFAFVNSLPIAVAGTGLMILGTLAFTIVYTRFLRPCPRSGTDLTNLTESALRQEENPLYWRIDLLDQIQKALAAKKGVMLIGEPGVGKSATIQSLAQYMVSDKCLDQSFRRKPLFEMKLNSSYGQTPFSALCKEFKNYSESVIFSIDEIQKIFKNENPHYSNFENKTKDDLKLFCNKFPYIIAATTKDEYKKYIESADDKKTILRRFTVIELKDLEPKEIENSLYYALRRKSPLENIVERDVIQYIAEKASKYRPDTSQIDAAHFLLSRALHELRPENSNQAEKEILKLEQDVEVQQTRLWYEQSNDGKNVQTHLDLNKKLNLKKVEMNQKKIDCIKNMEKFYVEAKKECYEVAATIQPYLKKAPELVKKWLKKDLLKQMMEESIKAQKGVLGLNAVLDKALIDKVIKADHQ